MRLHPTRDETKLLSLLDNLGKLPSGFDGELFVPLLAHANPKIRTLAVKNVGKLKNEKFLTELSKFAANESNTFARREAISAIGRMRSQKAIPILTYYLTDTDPKVIPTVCACATLLQGEPRSSNCVKLATRTSK